MVITFEPCFKLLIVSDPYPGPTLVPFNEMVVEDIPEKSSETA